MSLPVTPGSGANLHTQQPSIGGSAAHVQLIGTGAAPNLSCTNALVTTTAGSVLAARDERKGLMIQALDGTVYIGGSATNLASLGFRLQAGDAISSQAFIGAVFAVAASTSTNIRIWEEY